MKKLDDLIKVIEEPVAQGSRETIFLRKDGRYQIPKENLEILKQSPVLLSEAYGQLSMIQRHLIPEEADAVLLGQEGIFPFGVQTKIFSASYCTIKK